MRRHIKTLICILLLTLMIVPAAAFSAMAADGTTMTFDLKYHQSDARAMLKTINDYRKSQGQSELVYAQQVIGYGKENDTLLYQAYSSDRTILHVL